MGSFIHVGEYELEIGLEFAKTKFGVDLCRETLRILFDEISEKSRVMGGKNTHYEAKRQVLNKQMPQRTKQERERYTAYSSAIAKIASRRASFVRHMRASQPRARKAEIERIKAILVAEQNGQYSFL